VSGQFLGSKPKKMTGALVKMEHPHFADRSSQEAVWDAVVHLTEAEYRATTDQQSANDTTNPNAKISRPDVSRSEGVGKSSTASSDESAARATIARTEFL
jgi:hypothetical protein